MHPLPNLGLIGKSKYWERFALTFLDNSQDYNHFETTVGFHQQFEIGVRFCFETAAKFGVAREVKTLENIFALQ